MKKFVCIAGLPLEVVNKIKAQPAKRLTGDATNPPIIFPVREPYCYRPGMSDPYLHELSRKLSDVTHSQDAAILVAYVDYGGDETEKFIKNFFPFALIAPVQPFYPYQAPKSKRRTKLNGFIDRVVDVVDELASRVRTVRDVLSGRNFTPLLLPVRNFHSAVVRSEIENLFSTLGTSVDPRATLEGAVQVMLARHPLQRTEKPPTAYFEDARRFRFKSPGRDRHGRARFGDDGHRPSCFLGSQVRLGGPFDPCFHYDCEYGRGNLDRYYPNCHGVDTAPAATTHVNISPNDAVR